MTYRLSKRAVDAEIVVLVRFGLGDGNQWNGGPAFVTEIQRTDGGEAYLITVRSNHSTSQAPVQFIEIQVKLHAP